MRPINRDGKCIGYVVTAVEFDRYDRVSWWADEVKEYDEGSVITVQLGFAEEGRNTRCRLLEVQA